MTKLLREINKLLLPNRILVMDMSSITHSLAEADLTSRQVETTSDERGRLLAALQNMVQSLVKVVQRQTA